MADVCSASRGGRWRCLRGGLARDAGRPVRAPLAFAGGLAASGSRAQAVAVAAAAATAAAAAAAAAAVAAADRRRHAAAPATRLAGHVLANLDLG